MQPDPDDTRLVLKALDLLIAVASDRMAHDVLADVLGPAWDALGITMVRGVPVGVDLHDLADLRAKLHASLPARCPDCGQAEGHKFGCEVGGVQQVTVRRGGDAA